VMFILALSLLITVLYIHRFRRRFNDILAVLNKFREGDFTARFAEREKDELELVTGSFNKLADLLLDNINRVTDSEKERRDFMVNISHDLRTPLAIARGYAETLQLKKGQLGEEEVSEYSELVLSKIRQVEKMVGQLFELSKMESASFEMRREPFVFSEILQEVVRGRGWNDQVECQNCEDVSYVNADISMMERVLQNLVANAVAYTREGGRVFIRLDRVGGEVEGEGEELIFRIENQGEPLTAELLGWINGEGWISGEARPKKPAIGLAIVRKILALHKFPFRVEVLPGNINRFSFSMPIVGDPFGIFL